MTATERSLYVARYSTDHEWVSYDPDTSVGIVGITDYAQKALGDVVFVELPSQGTEVAQGGKSTSVSFSLSSGEGGNK